MGQHPRIARTCLPGSRSSAIIAGEVPTSRLLANSIAANTRERSSPAYVNSCEKVAQSNNHTLAEMSGREMGIL